MGTTKLNKAPLKEVIFELQWSGLINSFGMPEDVGLDLSQGKFADLIKAEFPVHKKLVEENSSVRTFGVPIHQYWKGELEWPVVQHGKGILTVNETEDGYTWEDSYKSLITSTVDILKKSYEHNLEFNRIKLQYIDAWDMDDIDPFEFMEKNLQTIIKTSYVSNRQRKNLNLLQSFELTDGSVLVLNMGNGINNSNQKKSVVCTIAVEKKSEISTEELIEWLDQAHEVTSNTFKDMLKPSFYDSLT